MPVFEQLGDLAATYRAVDWAATDLGPVETWDATLVGALDLVLNTRFPARLFWGPDLVLVYNEAYVPIIGSKHPRALGAPAADIFPEIWDIIGPMMHSILDGKPSSWVEDAFLPLDRRGFLEECYFTLSYSPVRAPDRTVLGGMGIMIETTRQVLSRRRLQLLGQLNAALADVEQLEEIGARALPLLRGATSDLPALDVRIAGQTQDGSDVGGRLSASPPATWDGVSELVCEDGPQTVAWLPLALRSSPHSHLVVEMSPRLAPDQEYLGFLRLIAASLGRALDRVATRTAERRAAAAERVMSEAFQRSLLPVPRRTGRPEVAVRYQPAVELAQLGGDWYDLVELPDGSLSVVIGDVAGHDQQSAAAMAQVRHLLRGVAYTLHPAPPSDILQGLDRAMGGMVEDLVATAVLTQVAVGDDGSLGLRWSNAGHPPPVLIDPDGHSRLLDTEPDLLLGLDDGTPRVDHDLQVARGSTVVFYTDGLVERRDASLTDGLDWLVASLADHHETGVGELCDHLLNAAGALEDDVALLVLRA